MKKRDRPKIANQMVIYQAKSGAIELRGDVSRETIWATQAQIASVFGIDRTVVTKHINNILKTNEIDKKSNVQKMHIANSDKPVTLFSLDVILAVGYRANSARAIEFRKWATKTLRLHITKGYTINREQIGKNYDAFMRSVADIQALLPEHVTLDPRAVLELIKEFASTWISLDAYDKESLTPVGVTKKAVKLTGEELLSAIGRFREELMKKKEATEIFAHERTKGSVEGIVGNTMQSFGGKPLYPSAEEKAAHLLYCRRRAREVRKSSFSLPSRGEQEEVNTDYFMVKNHPFTDGNKRSGAFAFVWFLRKARVKKFANINPATLTALTLLIAESDPRKKEQMTALVTQLLK